MDVILAYDRGKNIGIIQSEYLSNIREHFSMSVPKFGMARHNPYIPDRKYVITPTGQFALGLYAEILKFLRTQDIPFNVTTTDEFKNAIQQGYKNAAVVDLCPDKFPMRDYQREIVSICLKKGFGVVELATAGGKTLTMANLIENIVKGTLDPIKTLIIVPDIGLVNQTYGDFKDYGMNAERMSRWTGKLEINKEADIIIANMGILQSEISDLSWLPHISLLIVDETHKLRRDNKVNNIIKKIRTPHKFGFTGTMPTDLLDQWNIIGRIGPILYKRMAHELREDNYVAQSMVLVLEITYKSLPDYDYSDASSIVNYKAEMDFLIHNAYRNQVIAQVSQNFKNNALIMVDRIEHGQVMFDYLKSHLVGKEVFFIQGDVEVEDRKKVQDLMEVTTNVVCIAISKVFSTGINIKNLHYIVFAAGGKAKIKIVQSIGRGLRLHADKNILTIIDLADNLQYGIKHLAGRKLLYETEKIKYTTRKLTE
jgi:superfamily II DNA or RNA helicase